MLFSQPGIIILAFRRNENTRHKMISSRAEDNNILTFSISPWNYLIYLSRKWRVFGVRTRNYILTAKKCIIVRKAHKFFAKKKGMKEKERKWKKKSSSSVSELIYVYEADNLKITHVFLCTLRSFWDEVSSVKLISLVYKNVLRSRGEFLEGKKSNMYCSLAAFARGEV